jgi:hypothetical protein
MFSLQRESLCGRIPVNTSGSFPVAHLVESKAETFLFESRYVQKFVKAVEKRSRTGNLALDEFAVTQADAATAVDFYRGTSLSGARLYLFNSPIDGLIALTFVNA